MPWWFWLLFLVVLGVGSVALGSYLARRALPVARVREEEPVAGPVFPPEGPYGFLADMEEERAPCPVCLSAAAPPPLTGDALTSYRAAWERVDALIAGEKFDKALSALNGLIPVAPLTDHLRILVAVYDIFEGLCDERTPVEVLALFDDLAEGGGAMPFAISHGQTEELAAVLGYSLSLWPPAQSEADLAAAVAFLRQRHPLVRELLRRDPQSVLDFINLQATDVFGAWQDVSNSPEVALDTASAWIERKR